MLDYQLYGLRAGGFHLTNLLLHAANCVLLLAILKKMTGALWRSFFVAALFAWHPLHVESVAWIAERKDVLSGLFCLLTMLFYLRYVEAASVKSPKTKKMYGMALLFFLCGLLSKPMLVTLPFVLLLLDYWPLRRSVECGVPPSPGSYGATKRSAESVTASEPRAGKPWTGLFLEKAPFFALALVSSVVTFAVQKAGGAVAPLHKIPLNERIANALVAYVLYLRRCFGRMISLSFIPFSINCRRGSGRARQFCWR